MKLSKVVSSVLCIGAALSFLYLEERLSFFSLVVAIGTYILATAIHLVSHECGHLLGGLVSGYEFLCLQVSSFKIAKTEDKKIKFSWSKIHGGQCIMYPSHTDIIKYREYNLGGVVANAVIALFSVLLILANSFHLSLLMIEFFFVGICEIIVNLIPRQTDGIPNDGYIVKILNANDATRKDYALYLRLYADLFLNKAISPTDYEYEREEYSSEDELLFYNEIEKILRSISVE